MSSKANRVLFLRYDEVKAAWSIVDPVMRAWADDVDRCNIRWAVWGRKRRIRSLTRPTRNGVRPWAATARRQSRDAAS